jgi:hypothetical protein
MAPHSTKDLEVVKLRTRALIATLIRKTECTNPNQFGDWVNRESEKLGWPDTQTSNKWYQLLKGRLKKPPLDVVSMLCKLFPDAEELYHDGPANLWRALWGDASDPTVLWPLCRTRFCDAGPWHDEMTWRDIEADFLNERTFGETLRVFEGELLWAQVYKEPLTLRHLTEAIALYRLHRTINRLAVSEVNGVGAYRCIWHCLNDLEIWSELNSYRCPKSKRRAPQSSLDDDEPSAFGLIRDELVEMEIHRLTTERTYLASVGIQRHQIMLYADDPLPWMVAHVRWDNLNLEGAPTTPEIAESRATEILESAKRANSAFVLSLQTEDFPSGNSSHKVVHILSRVRKI